MSAPIVEPRRRPVIRVFISSTFSDFKHERDALQQRVFPELERYCSERRFQFQAIDLRWGVPSEATFAHRTMRICFEELRRSQEISPQPNFLILLGNRYGWRPLPEEISGVEFRRLEDEASSTLVTKVLAEWRNRPVNNGTINWQAKTEHDVLVQWYLKDENARPPHYILQPRTSDSLEGKDYRAERDNDDPQKPTPWDDMQHVLWGIINRAYPADLLKERFEHIVTLNEPLPSIVRFQASATEQEIWRGALSVDDAQQHVFAFLREIENTGGFAPTEIADFIDVDESGARSQVAKTALDDLKLHLRKRLGEENVIGLVPPTRLERARDPDGRSLVYAEGKSKGRPVIDVTTGHMDALCKQVEERLKAVITRQIDEYLATTAAVPTAKRQIEIERAEHQLFGQERAPEKLFVGRKEQLEQIRGYLHNDSHELLVVHGASGCGKTALLARAAQDISRQAPDGPIIRFIGMTPQSSTVRSLLGSLCLELRQRRSVHGFDAGQSRIKQAVAALQGRLASGSGRAAAFNRPLPSDLEGLIEELNEHLNAATTKRRLVIILDGLDQLADDDDGRALRWLPVRNLPASVKLIVSCRSDCDAGDPAGQPYIAITRRGIAAHNIIDVTALSLPEAHDLFFDKWLRGASRTLDPYQTKAVTENLKNGECRQPLYLRILFEEARLWHSGEKICLWQSGQTAPKKGEPVLYLLGMLFDRLCLATNHGAMAGYALAYLAAARRGLSETEILEVLYQDDTYRMLLEDASRNMGHTLPDNPKRIPIAIWSRLRFDLSPYLSERAAPGSTVLSFYHPEVGDYVRSRFLDNLLEANVYHEHLADYFAGQPLTARRIDEQPWQLKEAQQWERLYNLLACLPFLAAAYQADRFGVMDYWAQVEKNYTLHKADAYGAVLAAPEQYDTTLRQCLGRLLRDTGHPTEALALSESLVAQHRSDGDVDALSVALGDQAQILYQQNQLDKAMALQTERERLCRDLGDMHGVSAAIGDQSNILYAQEDMTGAMALLKKQERLCRDLGNRRGLCASFSNQARIRQVRGDMDGAQRLYHDAEILCRELGDPDRLCTVLGNQALILMDQDKRQEALQAYKMQESEYRKYGLTRGLQWCLGNQVSLLIMLGDYQGALSKSVEQQRLCEEIDHPEGVFQSLLNQATVHVAQHQLETALTLAERSLAVARERLMQAEIEKADTAVTDIRALLAIQEASARNESVVQRKNQAVQAWRADNRSQAQLLMAEALDLADSALGILDQALAEWQRRPGVLSKDDLLQQQIKPGDLRGRILANRATVLMHRQDYHDAREGFAAAGKEFARLGDRCMELAMEFDICRCDASEGADSPQKTVHRADQIITEARELGCRDLAQRATGFRDYVRRGL